MDVGAVCPFSCRGDVAGPSISLTGVLARCYLAPCEHPGHRPERSVFTGKTTIARSLQTMLKTPWLLVGIDDLIRAMPNEGLQDGSLLHIGETGQVSVGPGWRELEASWHVGVAAMVANGTSVIVDEVFLGGRESQERLEGAFRGLGVLWVGVMCDREVARAREALRPDRVPGMAESQASVVHEGV